MTDRDWIHLGLSILGCIPVVGIAANIANAVLYFQEGDALNGLLSVAGALIGVGGVTAAIGAAKGICALTTVGQAIKTAGVAYTAGASAMQTIEAASKTFNMLKENDFQWNEEILISAGQTALSAIGTVAGFKAVGSCIDEAAALTARGLACFVAGTKVLTDKGFKNIEDIEAGDYVYSTSDKTGESGYKEVLQVFRKETEVVTHVFYEVEKEDGKTRTEEIETTLNHLFWCEGEWKAAGTLKAGDLLTLADGSQVEVTEITYEDRHTTVYNMEVEDYHTYHVGEDGVWVHNTGDGCGVTSGAGKSTGAGEGGSRTIDPNEIRFSQSSVNGSSEITESMKVNGWVGDPIDVVQMPDGIYTTIDNTRVIAARQAGINVQANIHSYDDMLPLDYIERFTTKKGVPVTWGDAISLRIGNQNSFFRNNNSFGAFELNKIN